MTSVCIIKLLKTVDRIIGPPLSKITLKRYPKTSKIIKKILLIRPGGLGDAALLVPLVKELKIRIPEIIIDIVCESRNKGIFESIPYIDNIFNYWMLKDIIKLLNQEYDIIIDTEQFHKLSAIFSSIIKTKKRIGFATNNRERHYDISLPYFQKKYELCNFNSLFSRVIPNWDNSFSWNAPYLYVSHKQKEKIDNITRNINKPIVCVFPGASVSLRKWPSVRWARVAEKLWEMDLCPILLGSKKEFIINKEIDYYSKYPIMDLTNMLNIGEIAELFRRSKLLVSTDSGILHIAVIEGLKTVSLFGPGIPEKWGPKGKSHIIIRKNLKCSPCTKFGYTPFCKKKGLCMKLISINDVITAITKVINYKEV